MRNCRLLPFQEINPKEINGKNEICFLSPPPQESFIYRSCCGSSVLHIVMSCVYGLHQYCLLYNSCPSCLILFCNCR